jgi:hypothetical protein
MTKGGETPTLRVLQFKTVLRWCENCYITNYELQITNYKLRSALRFPQGITNYELQITNYELRITNWYDLPNIF